jgi:putative DNA-invertase from lambdoid prophage Rac
LLAILHPGDVVLAAKLDRMFRGTYDALTTIEAFKRRRVTLMFLDLGDVTSPGNCTGQLLVNVLAAVAEFERSLISERIAASKANLRRSNKHQGGLRPFGWALGDCSGPGRARSLMPDLAEQQAILDIVSMRNAGMTLMAIRDTMRGQGFAISHQSVANIVQRHQLVAEAAE